MGKKIIKMVIFSSFFFGCDGRGGEMSGRVKLWTTNHCPPPAMPFLSKTTDTFSFHLLWLDCFCFCCFCLSKTQYLDFPHRQTHLLQHFNFPFSNFFCIYFDLIVMLHLLGFPPLCLCLCLCLTPLFKFQIICLNNNLKKIIKKTPLEKK